MSQLDSLSSTSVNRNKGTICSSYALLGTRNIVTLLPEDFLQIVILQSHDHVRCEEISISLQYSPFFAFLDKDLIGVLIALLVGVLERSGLVDFKPITES